MEEFFKFLNEQVLPVGWAWLKDGLYYFFFTIVQWTYLLTNIGIAYLLINQSPWSDSPRIHPKDPKKRKLAKRMIVFYIGSITAIAANIYYYFAHGISVRFFDYNLYLLLTFIFANLLYMTLIKWALKRFGVMKDKKPND